MPPEYERLLHPRSSAGFLVVSNTHSPHCECRLHETSTFSPLARLLPNHTTPELLFFAPT